MKYFFCYFTGQPNAKHHRKKVTPLIVSTSIGFSINLDRTLYSDRVRHLIVGDVMTSDQILLICSPQSRVFVDNSTRSILIQFLVYKLLYIQRHHVINLTMFFFSQKINGAKINAKLYTAK